MVPPDALQSAAVCPRPQAELLVQYDHHRVKVANRWGIMITYPWMPLEEAADPLQVIVVFNPAPRHVPDPDQVRAIVLKHLLAPAEVQAVIDQLVFEDYQGAF